jgi:hypothetical protein
MCLRRTVAARPRVAEYPPDQLAADHPLGDSFLDLLSKGRIMDQPG